MKSRHSALVAAMLCLSAVAAAAEPPLAIDLGGGVKLEMMLIKKGTFTQGSPASEQGRNDDETQRQVTLTKDFYLGKFPVTIGQFKRFVQETGYRTEAERGTSGGFGFDGKTLVQRKDFTWRNPGFAQTDEHPVTIITYDDAVAFAAWLSKRAHRKVTLPTEAQWEYACRAGSTTRFYGGDTDDDLPPIAWYRTNAGDGTRPVGQKKSNAFGLYDMCGNVYQWCRDWYGPYENQAVRDPEETRNDRTAPPRRVLRGGSWLKEARHCRSAARWRNTPGSRNADNGFRVAASVEMMLEKDSGAAAAGGRSPATVSGTDLGQTSAGAATGFFGGLSPLHWLIVGIMCGGPVLVVLILLLVLLPRSARGPGIQPPWPPSGPQPGSLPVEPAADGFWLTLVGVEPGSTIRYRCRINGTTREDAVVAEAGPRQFVYTGGRPSDVVILEILAPGQVTHGRRLPTTTVTDVETVAWGTPPTKPPPAPRPPRPEPPPFAGFPAAY